MSIPVSELIGAEHPSLGGAAHLLLLAVVAVIALAALAVYWWRERRRAAVDRDSTSGDRPAGSTRSRDNE
jgi:uncharacterized iron-regulated membrane protein